MYGGSRIPGVLVDDASTADAVKEFGFKHEDEILLLERNLAGFRALVDRQQMTVRRQYNINPEADPMESSWWECCTLGLAQRDAFKAFDRKSNSMCGRVIFWDIQPLATEWSVAARGLYGLEVEEQRRGQGLATFLLGESLRHLMQQGVSLVQAQVSQRDTASKRVFEKLEFTERTRGVVYSKAI